jgi:hypothetical protein
MDGKAGEIDEQGHAEVLSSLQNPGKGVDVGEGSSKLLTELSAALNEGRTGRSIHSKEELFAELEERYLTPNTRVDKSLLGPSQMYVFLVGSN